MTTTPIQMRFADVDMLGHVNNVNQQHYLDVYKRQIPRYSEGASLFRAKYRIASMRSHLVRLPSNTFASEFQGAFRVKELNCYGQPPLIL